MSRERGGGITGGDVQVDETAQEIRGDKVGSESLEESE